MDKYSVPIKRQRGLKKSNNDRFFRPPVTSAQCIIGTDEYPDSAFSLSYGDDEYGQYKETFKALTEVINLNLYKADLDFRSFTENTDFGYVLYVFDIRLQ